MKNPCPVSAVDTANVSLYSRLYRSHTSEDEVSSLKVSGILLNESMLGKSSAEFNNRRLMEFIGKHERIFLSKGFNIHYTSLVSESIFSEEDRTTDLDTEVTSVVLSFHVNECCPEEVKE